MRGGPILPVLVGCLALGALEARASTLSVTPFLGVSAVFDDNILATSSQRVGDWAAGFSPGIVGDYRSTHFGAAVRYSVNGEVFPNEPSLNTPLARQTGSLGLSYDLNHRLSLQASGGYTQSLYSGDILISAVETGRRRTDGYSAQFGVMQKMRMDTLSLNYGFSGVNARDLGSGQAQSLTLDWTHRLGQRTSFSLSGGPRYSDTDRRTTATVSAGVHRQLGKGGLSLTYSNGYTLLPSFGTTGNAKTQSVGASLDLRAGRSFRMSVSPGYSESVALQTKIRVFHSAVGAAYEMARWLYLQGSYNYTFQKMDFGDEFPRNIFSVGFTLTLPRKQFLAVLP